MKIKYFIRLKGYSDYGKSSTITHTFLKILEKKVDLKGIETFKPTDFVALVCFKEKI